jgi:general secretion pathway protein G
MHRRHFARHGFTLIELLIVMAILATLLTVALPRYFGSVERSKEVTLKQSLSVMRDAIDKYYADRGRYPESLAELAQARYVRSIPVDPVTGSADGWVTVPPPDGPLSRGGVYDVRSGAPGKSQDGRSYSEF